MKGANWLEGLGVEGGGEEDAGRGGMVGDGLGMCGREGLLLPARSCVERWRGKGDLDCQADEPLPVEVIEVWTERQRPSTGASPPVITTFRF